jgi:NAD(P)-dependent dehydrogenase (short-subunit alcohol dehydrogenase family)
MRANNTVPTDPPTPVALITGGSRGLGAALASALVERGWRVVLDGRDPARLADAIDALPLPRFVTAVPGDVTDAAHRARLIEAAQAAGGLDLLVNNASSLGQLPLPPLAEYRPDALAQVLDANVVAPLALAQAALPLLTERGGRIVNVSSDAAVEAYPGWGGYGASKAALDLASAVLAVENPALRVYAFDPGDMRTDLARQVFSEQEFVTRPEPTTVVPALLRLLDGSLPSGRFSAADLATAAAA